MLGALLACASSSASPGPCPLATVLPAMLGVHALIGIGEAVITVAALSAVLATRPDLIDGAGFGPLASTGRSRRPRRWRHEAHARRSLFVALALALAVGLATAVSPVTPRRARTASRGWPATRASSRRARLHAVQEDVADPRLRRSRASRDERLATGVAGFVGTLGDLPGGLRHRVGPAPHARTAEGATAP